MYQEKNNSRVIAIIILLAFVVSAVFAVVSYNGLIAKKEAVDKCYADISAQLQRRSDLIPNLVNTVKGYMEHEQAIIDSITASRERLMNTTDPSETGAAANALTEALSSLMVVAENYPELKANENFIALQDELAGTENRIAVARRDYNSAVEKYNSAIRKIPGVFFAKLLDYSEAAYFQAAAGTAEAPNVGF